MKICLKRLILLLSGIRLAPHIILMLLSSSRNLIWADLDRWVEIWHLGQPRNLAERILLFANVMTFWPEYRNVFYLRTGLPGMLV